jgi:hypothetical protein
MTSWLAALVAVFLSGTTVLAAGGYRVEKLPDGPPADDLAAEVVAALSTTGYKVLDADGKPMLNVWLAKEVATNADFQPTLEILYPVTSGSLVGAVNFPRKGADFRGQEIARGTYTLRYANQPQDGNHVGTFETRDFLLMLPAASDRDPKTLAGDDFFATSAEAAQSTHPAIIPLLKPGEGAAPAMRHVEEVEWWVLKLEGAAAKGAKQPLELVVVGKAAE